MNELVNIWLIPLISLIAIVDPVAAVPSFLSMTARESAEHRRTIIRNACLTCVGLMVAFALGGTLIFKVFAITIPAFRIAGGLILGKDRVRHAARRTPPCNRR